MSIRWSQDTFELLDNCSGAWYASDPHLPYSKVFGLMVTARPKSATCARRFVSKRIFSGFKSPCIMLWMCNSCNPRTISVVVFCAQSRGILPERCMKSKRLPFCSNLSTWKALHRSSNIPSNWETNSPFFTIFSACEGDIFFTFAPCDANNYLLLELRKL